MLHHPSTPDATTNGNRLLYPPFVSVPDSGSVAAPGVGIHDRGERSSTDEPETNNHDGTDGWLIAQKLSDGQLTGRYLQIATGQWGPPSYATLFTLPSDAMVYAKEFGYSIGYGVDVVPGSKHSRG